MCRFLAAFLFTALICLASDCHAQRLRGRTARDAQVQHGPRHHETRRFEKFNNRERPARFQQLSAPRPQTSRNAEILERYPKYIGGFHASHYYNVGLPPGDNGFRGNGLYWAPWQ